MSGNLVTREKQWARALINASEALEEHQLKLAEEEAAEFPACFKALETELWQYKQGLFFEDLKKIFKEASKKDQIMVLRWLKGNLRRQYYLSYRIKFNRRKVAFNDFTKAFNLGFRGKIAQYFDWFGGYVITTDQIKLTGLKEWFIELEAMGKEIGFFPGIEFYYAHPNIILFFSLFVTDSKSILGQLSKKVF